jgi:hypothetical protein
MPRAIHEVRELGYVYTNFCQSFLESCFHGDGFPDTSGLIALQKSLRRPRKILCKGMQRLGTKNQAGA